jgi:hypothetical protein
MWSILIMTLPTQPNAVRLRIWRALKSLGCAALRDGAYLLPQAQAGQFDVLATEIREHGGSASVMSLHPRDATQQQEVENLFDRSQAYAQWCEQTRALQTELPSLGEAQAWRRLRAVADALQGLQGIDYYPGAAALQAAGELQAVRQALDAIFSKGEPTAQAARSIARLQLSQYQGKRWATRTRPRVDRLACAWLIGRFIDPQARFIWLQDTAELPRGALGFDFDGARFTHVGARVSFEVLAASFGLDADLKLQRIGQLVRYLDAGGIPVPEASGLEAVLSGLREVHADDEALRLAAATVFDALYAAPDKNQ